MPLQDSGVESELSRSGVNTALLLVVVLVLETFLKIEDDNEDEDE